MTRLGDKNKLYYTKRFPNDPKDHDVNLGTATTWGDRLGRWTDFTPTVTQGAAVTYTQNYGRYAVIGDTVWLACMLTLTGGGTASNLFHVANLPTQGIPIAAGGVTRLVVGTFEYTRPSVINHVGCVYFLDPNTLEFAVENTAAQFGIAPAITVTNGDQFSFSITYEARTR